MSRIDELKKQIAKLKEELKAEKSKKKPFARAEENDDYYCINTEGFIIEVFEESFKQDDIRYDIANYCTNKDLLQQRACHEILNRQLWRFACENGELEVYSDDPEDISTMEYADFLKTLDIILAKSIEMLADDRFCIITVGDIRDKNGFYRDFISDTKSICKKHGVQLYNEFILCECIGTGALRITKQFNSKRKHLKRHQNVLVFYKGNPDAIQDNFPPLDFSGIEELFEENIDEEM